MLFEYSTDKKLENSQLNFFLSYVFISHIGPRRIFTKRPVDERYLVHSVQFGRSGRKGWLQVDSFANITGKAPGSRENLNITSKVSNNLITHQ
jgi:hypothetical protein